VLLITNTRSLPVLSEHRELINRSLSDLLGSRDFNIDIRYRSDWPADISLPVQGLVCFKDGSKTGDSKGSGVLVLGRKLIELVDLYESSASVPLGSMAMATVFQTKIHAI